MVTDPSMFAVQGEGLDLVRVNQTASFNVCAPCAQCEDIGISIIGLLLYRDLFRQTSAYPVIYRHFIYRMCRNFNLKQLNLIDW